MAKIAKHLVSKVSSLLSSSLRGRNGLARAWGHIKNLNTVLGWYIRLKTPMSNKS